MGRNPPCSSWVLELPGGEAVRLMSGAEAERSFGLEALGLSLGAVHERSGAERSWPRCTFGLKGVVQRGIIWGREGPEEVPE